MKTEPVLTMALQKTVMDFWIDNTLTGGFFALASNYGHAFFGGLYTYENNTHRRQNASTLPINISLPYPRRNSNNALHLQMC